MIIFSADFSGSGDWAGETAGTQRDRKKSAIGSLITASPRLAYLLAACSTTDGGSSLRFRARTRAGNTRSAVRALFHAGATCTSSSLYCCFHLIASNCRAAFGKRLLRLVLGMRVAFTCVGPLIG